MKYISKSLILINAIRCTSPGSREVVVNIIKKTPFNFKLILVAPSNIKSYIFQNTTSSEREKYFFLFLSHKLFGIILGLPFELIIGILAKSRAIKKHIILSNYSLSISNNSYFYLHNKILISNKNNLLHPKFFIKNILLKLSLNKAKLIFVQTDHMKDELVKFCIKNKVNYKRIIKLPINLPDITEYKNKESIYPFQFFYPCDNLLHKRQNLAIESIVETNKTYKDIGLVITNFKHKRYKEIKYTKNLDRKKINEFYSSSKALLITSKEESLGLPILEAISHSIPVVAPYLPYAIELLGESGCYFYGEGINDICKAIILCYENYDLWKEKIEKRRIILNKNPCSHSYFWEMIDSF